MKRIIYPTDNGGIAVITPVDPTLSLAYIAAKDVPKGVPYLFINIDDMPTERSDRAAWEADFSKPDGYGQDFGIGSNKVVIAQNGDTITLKNEQTGEVINTTFES